MQYSPTFELILQQIRELPESGYGTPDSRKLFAMARTHAPDVFNIIFENKMRQLGLLPEPERYDDKGNSLITLPELAAFHGQSIEDIQAIVQEINGHYRAALLKMPIPEASEGVTSATTD